MMTAMENIPSPESTSFDESQSQQVDMRPDPAVQPPSPSRDSRPSGPGWSSLFCSCCSKSGVSRKKVEPVIFQPLDDVYLQLKPGRRLRVIHINSLGSLPNPRTYFYNNDDSKSSSSDDDYWFLNADPRRPKIQATSGSSQPPTRIFNKFEPQVRPTIEGLTVAAATSSTGGRLPRKVIKDVCDDDDDFDEEDDDEIDAFHPENPESHADVPGNSAGLPDKPESPLSSSVHARSPSPDMDAKTVITLPDPGESSTDEPTGDDFRNEANNRTSGTANVAFESEEFDGKNGGESGDDVALKSVGRRSARLGNTINQVDETDNNNAAAVLPAIFFIHGVGGSANVWNNQLVYFSKLGHEVIAPDLLGHGFSSAPDKAKSYKFVKLLRDTVTVFDHFVPRARECVVVAHSYGTALGAALARSRPESVRVLVMCASGGPTPMGPPKILPKIPPFLLACAKPLLKCRAGGAKAGGGKKPSPRGKSVKIPDAFDVPAYVLHHVLMGQHWPEGDSSYYRRITVPTLLVYGMKDPLVSLVEMCEMERTIPKSYLELIPLAAHMPMQDQPSEFNVMLKKFILRYFT